jgi:hypothetical protein
MARRLLRLLPVLALFMLALPAARPDEKATEKPEMVDNPYYQFWAPFKEGSTATHIERTKVGGEGEVDEKRITYKLLKKGDKGVLVETVVTERETFGTVQAAPTRHSYPAKMKKADLERFLLATGAKLGEETINLGKKEWKVKTVTGTVKAPGGEVTEYRIWLSEEVPGSIVKKVRTTRSNKGEMIAETTVTIGGFKKAE